MSEEVRRAATEPSLPAPPPPPPPPPTSLAHHPAGFYGYPPLDALYDKSKASVAVCACVTESYVVACMKDVFVKCQLQQNEQKFSLLEKCPNVFWFGERTEFCLQVWAGQQHISLAIPTLCVEQKLPNRRGGVFRARVVIRRTIPGAVRRVLDFQVLAQKV